jgi:hypothetical protein
MDCTLYRSDGDDAYLGTIARGLAGWCWSLAVLPD